MLAPFTSPTPGQIVDRERMSVVAVERELPLVAHRGRAYFVSQLRSNTFDRMGVDTDMSVLTAVTTGLPLSLKG